MHQDNQNPLKPSHRLVRGFNLCGPHFGLNPHNSSGMHNPNWQDSDTSKSAPAKNGQGALSINEYFARRAGILKPSGPTDQLGIWKLRKEQVPALPFIA